MAILGLFIAISLLLEKIKTKSHVDIFGIVNHLRFQRNNLVQTKQEYIFIYTSIAESLLDGNTELPASDLYGHIQHLSISNKFNSVHNLNDLNHLQLDFNLTGFQLEFRKIVLSSPIIASFDFSKRLATSTSSNHKQLNEFFRILMSSNVAKSSVS